jgi:hypothetical protein
VVIVEALPERRMYARAAAAQKIAIHPIVVHQKVCMQEFERGRGVEEYVVVLVGRDRQGSSKQKPRTHPFSTAQAQLGERLGRGQAGVSNARELSLRLGQSTLEMRLEAALLSL